MADELGSLPRIHILFHCPYKLFSSSYNNPMAVLFMVVLYTHFHPLIEKS